MSEDTLPENWILGKLGDITEIVGGGTPSRDNPLYFAGDIPWVTPTDVTRLNDLWVDETAESITLHGLNNSSSVLLPVGTVLMTSRATIGVTAINRRPMSTNQGFANFICNEQVLFNEYLAYWLPAIKQRLIQLAGGTTFKEISRSSLSKVEIPLPPLPEQRHIVTILREADEIRKLRRRANEKTQEIVLALFYEMFGDPVRQHPGWDKKTLGEFVDVTSSLVDPRKKEYQELFHVGSDNIDSATGRFLFLHSVRNIGAISGKFLFTDQNILYSKIRPALRKVATPNFSGLCSADIYPLEYDRKQVSKLFLAQLLRSNDFTNYAIGVSERAQIPKINREDLLKYQTVLPDPDVQKEFERRAEEAILTRSELDIFSSKLDTLYQSLLARAFTGDLTATWREQHAEELSHAARERDHLLTQLRLAPAELVTPAQPIRSEISERQELLALLNDVQRALLAMINEQIAIYYTANSAYEELVTIECSLDIVRRELHFLATAGWIKEQTLLAEAESGSVRYIPVYRPLLPDDDSQQQDIDQLITRLGSEYPDEVLV